MDIYLIFFRFRFCGSTMVMVTISTSKWAGIHLQWNLYGNNLTLNILSFNEGLMQCNEFLAINFIVYVDLYDVDEKLKDNLIDIYGNNNTFH